MFHCRVTDHGLSQATRLLKKLILPARKLLVLIRDVVHHVPAFHQIMHRDAILFEDVNVGATLVDAVPNLDTSIKDLVHRRVVGGKDHRILFVSTLGLANVRCDRIGDPIRKELVIAGSIFLKVIQDLVHFFGLVVPSPGRPGRQKACFQNPVVVVARIQRVAFHRHVVFGEHLLRNVKHTALSILFRSFRCERSQPTDEEMRVLKGHQVRLKLSKVRIQGAGVS
mmetsp:Transcript_69137/g.109112  ORF Transcript_69137/g.109112 Transcript_69137/m.109112 type:complete len:225 (-) Transcript_69137:819-1493(-)